MNSRLEYLNLQFEELKYVFNSPGLFLSAFFDDLKNQIDTECEKFLVSQKDSEIDRVLEYQIQIIHTVNLFERDCFKELSNNESTEFFANHIEKFISDIEGIISKEMSSNDLRRAEELIYNCLLEIHRQIFRNKAIVFLSKETCFLEIKSFGVLLFIEDEFIGKREMEILRLVKFFKYT